MSYVFDDSSSLNGGFADCLGRVHLSKIGSSTKAKNQQAREGNSGELEKSRGNKQKQKRAAELLLAALKS